MTTMKQNLLAKKKITSFYVESYMKTEMKSVRGSGWDPSGGDRTDSVEPGTDKKDSMDISLKRHCEIV